MIDRVSGYSTVGEPRWSRGIGIDIGMSSLPVDSAVVQVKMDSDDFLELATQPAFFFAFAT